MLQRLRSDPASLLAVLRFAGLLALTLLLLALTVPVAQRTQFVAAMMGVQALYTAGLAVFLREPFYAPCLNRWDEAVAFLLLHFAMNTVT